MTLFQKITRRQLEAFLARHATAERTLDIGSGGSSYDRYFPNRVTIDIDPARNPQVVGDAHALPFKDGEFSSVLCTEVLEHLEDPPKAIAEMHRVLRQGGTLILTTRFVYPIHDAPHDYWRFTRYGLEKLFSQWEIRELHEETRAFSTMAALLQRMAFQSRMVLDPITKLMLFVQAAVLDKMNFVVRAHYADIQKSAPMPELMPTGYHMICKKK